MNRNLVSAVGLGLLVAGMQGFAVAGFSGIPSPDAARLAFLSVNPLQNALHLAVGWSLVSAARTGIGPARRSALLVAVVLGVLGALGAVAGNLPANPLGLDAPRAALHTAGAIALSAVALRARVGDG